ncbi:hypothetical protein PYCCODRAFT_1433368 [Trametes coccinea BRFM310]|uniref:F-box domain-containing protein n=1 Tax=Trametes coccinea (strain BRFM310) TaxID=1353009 RepID=A0A1Y2ITM7_TRAC3|nr:hypothetical protein PYCCODRAFT_1433368 [Trametes coccinea BRFM310]
MFDVTRIPTEVWQDILRSACTDGGFTGRSLATTSKFFLAQSYSIRYHSLLFDSLQRLLDFLGYWDAKMINFPRGIHHLYLSFLDEPWLQPPIVRSAYYRMHYRDRQAYNYRASPPAKQRWSKTFVLGLRTLLTMVASSLRTLCIVLPDLQDVWLRIIFSGLGLYRLEELTWLGCIAQDESPSQFLRDDLPSLKRFHCICKEGGEFRLSTANAVVPYLHDLQALTHLRISHMRRIGSLSIASDLAIALGISSTVKQSEEGPTRAEGSVPLCLRHVVLQWARRLHSPRVRPSKGVRGQRLLAEIDGMCMLIVHQPWTRDVSTDPPWGARWAHQLRIDWSDRMEGGIGCWFETKEQDYAWMRRMDDFEL